MTSVYHEIAAEILMPEMAEHIIVDQQIDEYIWFRIDGTNLQYTAKLSKNEKHIRKNSVRTDHN